MTTSQFTVQTTALSDGSRVYDVCAGNNYEVLVAAPSSETIANNMEACLSAVVAAFEGDITDIQSNVLAEEVYSAIRRFTALYQ